MPLLTPEQVARLQQIIRDGSTALAVATTGYEATPDEIQRLVDLGYIDPQNIEDLVLDSFTFGQVMERMQKAQDWSYKQFESYLAKNPVKLSDQEKRAYEVARTRAGMFCRGLGDRYSAELGGYVVQADQALATQTRGVIAEEVGRHIATRTTTGELRTRLRQLTQDWARDWDRIAATESHLAHQEGLLESTVERHGADALMAKSPEPTACERCNSLYRDPANGRPIIKPASWWHEQGVSNVGRKAADWKPVLGAMHPWCRCQLVRVPEGFGVDEEGVVLPLSMLEEDAEKSERRPGANLKKALYIGPRGGKWQDPEHTIPWKEETTPARAAKREEPAQLGLFDMTPAQLQVRAADPEEWGLPAGARVEDPWEPKPPDPNAKWKHPDFGAGKGEAPWEVPGWEPDLHEHDYVMINTSAGKDSQAMMDHLVKMADKQGYPREKLIAVHADLGRAEWAGTLELAKKQAEHYGLRFEVVQREKNDLVDQIEARYGTLIQRQADTARLLVEGIDTWDKLFNTPVADIVKIIQPGYGTSEWNAEQRAEKMIAKAKKNITKKGKAQEARRVAAQKALDAATERLGKATAVREEMMEQGRDRKGDRTKLEAAQRAVEKAEARIAEDAVDYRDQRVDFGEPIPWPSSNARFCTSDHKNVVVAQLITQLAKEHKEKTGETRPTRFLNAMGIRAQESANREKMTSLSRETETENQHVDRWYPIHDWHEEKVWKTILDSKVPYHKAYSLGMRRLSCVFCVYAGKEDLMIAAAHNPKLFKVYLELEQKVGSEFKKGQSLEDIRKEIQTRIDAGYRLNELAEWVKKSYGFDLFELGDSLVKSLGAGEDYGLSQLVLEAALARLQKHDQEIVAVQVEWKVTGACVHLDTETTSHHVEFLPYPAAYQASLGVVGFARRNGLAFEEHNAPGVLPAETEEPVAKGGPYIGPRGGKWKDPKHTIPWKEESLHERYGGRGAPKEGEKGHKPPPERPKRAWDGQEPFELAMDMLTQAQKVWTDSDYAMVYQTEPGDDVGFGDFTRADLPDLLHVPFRNEQGEVIAEEDRGFIAERLVEIAATTVSHGTLDPVGIELPPQKHRKREVADWDPERFRGEESGWSVPLWVAAAVLADSMDRGNRKLRLVNVSKPEAAQFIEQHHKALPYLNPRGLMYAIGVKRGGRLVAVATAGHPTGRAIRGIDPKNVVELTRVASDGTTKNAASMLTARLLDLLQHSKRGDPDAPALFVTYQLEGEKGDTYRALKDKGLRPVEFIQGKAKPGGKRPGVSAESGSLAAVNKIRWEAGEAAGPAKWSLLEGGKQLPLVKARKLHGRMQWNGLDISVENRKGSVRHWTDAETGTEGKTKMEVPYGYIRMTEGADGDHVDCFMGPKQDASFVYVIHQLKAPTFREFDENKVMLGFPSAFQARRAYRKHYDSGKFFGGMTTIPAQQFVERVKEGAYRDGEKIMKSQLKLPIKKTGGKKKSAGAGWHPIPGGRVPGGFRRRKGDGWEYKYVKHATGRAAVGPGQDIAGSTLVFVNASGGAEFKRFVKGEPGKGFEWLASKMGHLGEKNVGVQMTAKDILEARKTEDAAEDYRDHLARAAWEHGTKLMIDSGEFGRFSAAKRGEDPPDLDWDRVLLAYEFMAARMPRGDLQVVAPDRIADPEMTKKLRREHAERVRELIEEGVEIQVPIQSHDPKEMVKDAEEIFELFGKDQIILSFPSNKNPTPMSSIMAMMLSLYRRNIYPKVHFLGLGDPKKTAGRTAQLVAAVYWLDRGLPLRKVVEKVKSADAAQASLDRVKAFNEINPHGAEGEELSHRVMSWALKQKLVTREEAKVSIWSRQTPYDRAAMMRGFFEAHKEEFDSNTPSLSRLWRVLANRLAQADSTAVSQAQRYRVRHDPLTGSQREIATAGMGLPPVEQFHEVLDYYVSAREHALERRVSGKDKLKEMDKAQLDLDLGKAVSGEIASSKQLSNIGTMGHYGDPARTAGENVRSHKVGEPQDWPPGREDMKKKGRRRLREVVSDEDDSSISTGRDGYRIPRAAEKMDVVGQSRGKGGWAKPLELDEVETLEAETRPQDTKQAKENLTRQVEHRIELRENSKLHSMETHK